MGISGFNNFNYAAMGKIRLLVIFIFGSVSIYGQRIKIDSLKMEIAFAKEDTTRIGLLEQLAQSYRDEKEIDSCILTNQQALQLNEKINYSLLRQCYNMSTIDYLYYVTGNYTKSLEYASRALILSERLHDLPQMAHVHQQFGFNYIALGDYRQALSHYFKAKELFERHNHPEIDLESPAFAIVVIGYLYLKLNQPDSALMYVQRGYQLACSMSQRYVIDYSLRMFGDIFLTKKNNRLALNYYRQYTKDFYQYNENNRDICFVYLNEVAIFRINGEIDSSLFYAKKALESAEAYHDQENLFKAADFLYDFYKDKDDHAAFGYLKIATEAKDSLVSIEKMRQIQSLSFNEQIRENEQAEADAKEAAKERMAITSAAILVLILSFLTWYRIRQLRLRYKMVLERKEAEKLKVKYEKKLLELEANALRAQMNPHFIFNCMNSIKALIQKQEEDNAVSYLTTFSKLIRTIFQNSDKREITLFEEIETCRFYTKLESMRFGSQFNYQFDLEDSIDLKSVMVPALILQPFIENAIWHGIMPKKETGTVTVSVERKGETILCVIDDNGIGRELSNQNKFETKPSTHQSKGVSLTKSRLDLDNLLNDRKAYVEIIDKKDEGGRAVGTKVVIQLTEY